MALTFAGVEASPILVQRISTADGAVGDDLAMDQTEGRPFQFLSSGPLHDLAVDAFLATNAEWEVRLLCPLALWRLLMAGGEGRRVGCGAVR